MAPYRCDRDEQGYRPQKHRRSEEPCGNGTRRTLWVLRCQYSLLSVGQEVDRRNSEDEEIAVQETFQEDGRDIRGNEGNRRVRHCLDWREGGRSVYAKNGRARRCT